MVLSPLPRPPCPHLPGKETEACSGHCPGNPSLGGASLSVQTRGPPDAFRLGPWDFGRKPRACLPPEWAESVPIQGPVSPIFAVTLGHFREPGRPGAEEPKWYVIRMLYFVENKNVSNGLVSGKSNWDSEIHIFPVLP